MVEVPLKDDVYRGILGEASNSEASKVSLGVQV